jgi:pyruvate,water dikinase
LPFAGEPDSRSGHNDGREDAVTDVVWLDDVLAGDASLVGGKAASLAALIGAGLPVPPGFAITTTAYLASRDAAGHDKDIARHLAAIPGASLSEAGRTCELVRGLVRTMPMPRSLEESIRDSYAALCRRQHDPSVPVAVRSSATGEDSADASFAGEHDTFLWVRGGDAVVDAVRSCWASLFTDRVVSYRAEMGLDHLRLAMGVVVQAMVQPISAGVAFTLNPSNGDRSVIAIDSSWGFGEAVVSGEVTPDSFLVDKVMQSIVWRVISAKEHEFVLDDEDRIVRADVAGPRITTSSLTDDQVLQIAGLARQSERQAKAPQDVEWAVVAGPDGTWSVTLLQTRPETVWSRFTPDTVASATTDDPMSNIVNTLISPLHDRRDD